MEMFSSLDLKLSSDSSLLSSSASSRITILSQEMRKRDKFWEYAEDLNGRFKCKFCKKEYHGSISRVKSHLSGITGRDVGVCSMVPDDVQAEAVSIINGGAKPSGNKRARSSSGSVGYEGDANSGVREAPTLQQTSIPIIVNKKNKEAVDMKVAQFFFLNNISFNVIQTPACIEMAKAISNYGVGYSLPSYSTLRTKLVADTKEEVEAYVNTVKESWNVTGCTIMSDIWTDIKRKSYINVVAYSPKGVVFLKSFERSDHRNTGLYIRDTLLSVINEVGPHNVVQIVTDNAANYNLANDLIMTEHPHIIKTKCAAHGAQLLLEDIYKKVDWVKNIFLNARKIYDYLYRHITVLALMREYTKKDLRKYSDTRFASHFLLIQSILEVEDGLRNLVASASWRNMQYSRGGAAINVKDIIQGTEFWEEAGDLVKLMEPLVILLRLVDGDGSTSAYIYEAQEKARTSLRNWYEKDQVKYLKIWQLFNSRVKSNILHKFHAFAMYLNPSLMYDGKVLYDQQDVREAILFVGEKMIDVDDRSEFARELLVYNGKHPDMFTFISVPQMKTFHPRVWWEANGSLVPILKRIAIRLLSLPCSASACERNWSAFNAAQTKKRNRLAPEMLEDLVYIRVNSLMMRNAADFELKDRMPIDLENLTDLNDEDVIECLDEAADEAFVESNDQTNDNSWLDGEFGDGSSSRPTTSGFHWD